jgi:LysM repeat protein
MRRMLIIFVSLSLLTLLVGNTSAQGNTTIHIVQRGETLYRIALRYGTTVQAIASANNIANVNRIFAGQRLTIPAPVVAPAPPLQGTTIYIVGRGDYLAAIARRFGTTVQAIANANNIFNPNLIYPGQQLRIPIA